MNRGPCQMLQQETADTRVSLYAPASRDARTTRFQAWPHSPEQTPPRKECRSLAKGANGMPALLATRTYRFFQHRTIPLVLLLECCKQRQCPHFVCQTTCNMRELFLINNVFTSTRYRTGILCYLGYLQVS